MEISSTLGIESRKEAKCMGADNKGSHLTKEERKIIAKGIESGATKTAIGRGIGKDKLNDRKRDQVAPEIGVEMSIAIGMQELQTL